jgi:prepilin-type N-terminal cleavage/methylation domain-containing protein
MDRMSDRDDRADRRHEDDSRGGSRPHGEMNMNRNHRRSGFTLIELMIVVSIIAIVSSLAVPKLLAARVSADEAAAISTLRSISSAQGQIKSSGAIDTDGDGNGEYGYFAELSGTVAMRVATAAGPGAGGVHDKLAPAMLSAAFGTLNNSLVSRSGYDFQMWLPGATMGGLTPGIAEDAGGGKIAAPFPDPDNGEVFWCCYAWPMQTNGAGNRAFCVNQEGELLQCLNRNPTPYSGTAKTPAFDEAYKTLGDLASGFRIGAPAGGHDNTIWVPVQ